MKKDIFIAPVDSKVRQKRDFLSITRNELHKYYPISHKKSELTS